MRIGENAPVCPECGKEELVLDERSGYSWCPECGYTDAGEKLGLKNCPFCGGRSQIIRGGPKWFYPACGGCLATINEIFLTPEEAVQAWNGRENMGYSNVELASLAEVLRWEGITPDDLHRLINDFGTMYKVITERIIYQMRESVSGMRFTANIPRFEDVVDAMVNQEGRL